MKILISSIVDLNKSMHNRPHQFIRYLSRKNDITVLSVKDWWKSKHSNLEGYGTYFDDELKNVDYRYITELKIRPFLQKLFLHKQLAQLAEEEFDVHLSYNSMIMGRMIAPRIPTVLDLADDLLAMLRFSPQIPRAFRPVGETVGRNFLNSEIKKSKRITVTLASLGETLHIPKEKTTVISNGVDTDFFTPRKKDKPDELNGFILGYVGVLREWVDLKSIFKALKLLSPDIKLFIVGYEGRFKANVELAKKYGVSDRVIFNGMVHYSQVPRCLSVIDVGLIPFKPCDISRSALPMKLFEYFACEKPVISSNLDGVGDTVGARALYSSTVEGYVENIEMLYNDSKLREKLGKQGRDFVAAHHDWEKITNHLELELRDVVYS
jgi:glycosyltransferase involved in cell wall biosynthesis